LVFAKTIAASVANSQIQHKRAACPPTLPVATVLGRFPRRPGLSEKSMRMPLLSYFLVAGIVLFGGLILVSSQLESKPLPVSQRIGVPPPFKAPPNETQSPTSGVDSTDESNVRD
jgi:hypothetical protein